MPKFKIPITRDVTETAQVVVDAKNLVNAQYYALTIANHEPQTLKWEADDCMGGEPYIADPDSGEEVDAN